MIKIVANNKTEGGSMRIGTLLFYVAWILSHSCMGYLCSGYALKRNQHNGPEQCIILLGDFHQKIHPCYEQQNNDLNLLLHSCLHQNGKLIVEDLSSPNNEGKGTCGSFLMKNDQSLLGKLADKARAMNIDVDNVEYRYCRLLSLAPLLNDLNADPYSISSTKHITMFALYSEIINQIKKIQSYKDTSFVSLYSSTIEFVRKELNELSFTCYKTKKDCSVAQYCSRFYTTKHYQNILEKLCIFDSALVDMSILHSIAINDKKLFILIIAGASHIEQVKNVMIKFDYTIRRSFPPTAEFKPINVKNLFLFQNKE
jgi:hypothetical protein